MEDFAFRDGDEFFKLSFLKRFLLGTNGIIAGGCFKNIFNGERVKDIDIFFRDKRDFSDANKKYQDNSDFTLAYKNENVLPTKKMIVELLLNYAKRRLGNQKSC